MASLNDVFRVACRSYGPDGQDIINVWYCKIDTLVSGVNADVAADIQAEVSANYQYLEPLVSNGQGSTDISIQNITTGEVFGNMVFSPAYVGTLTGETVPPQASLYAYFRTGLSRRIGRKFFGILTEAAQAAGVLDGTLGTAMQALISQWIGPWTGATTGNSYTWGVYNSAFLTAFVAFVEAVYTRRLMTQRRRRPSVGS